MLGNPEFFRAEWAIIKHALANVINEYHKYSLSTVELALNLLKQLMQTGARDTVIELCREIFGDLQLLQREGRRNLVFLSQEVLSEL